MASVATQNVTVGQSIAVIEFVASIVWGAVHVVPLK
jgi:uncharacterized membrane protein (DUF485 family)